MREWVNGCHSDTGKLQGRASAAGEAYKRVGVSQHASVLHGEKKQTIVLALAPSLLVAISPVIRGIRQ